MKNTFKILGIIALVALIGLSVVSCKDAANDVKEVKVSGATRSAYAVAKTATSGTIYTATSIDYQILEWVALGKNVTKYEVYYRKDLKDNVTAFPTQLATYGYGYDGSGRWFDPSNDGDFIPAGGTVSTNTRPFKDDTWFARIPVNMGGIRPGSYYFGVRAFVTDDKYSNIVWTKNKIEIKADLNDTLDFLYTYSGLTWTDQWLGAAPTYYTY